MVMRYFKGVDEGLHDEWGCPTYWLEVNHAGDAEPAAFRGARSSKPVFARAIPARPASDPRLNGNPRSTFPVRNRDAFMTRACETWPLELGQIRP